MAGKSKSWTAERRAKQSEWMKKNRPWENATGPKTPEGKDAVKDNALKHGYRSADYKMLLALLRAQAEFTESVKNQCLSGEKRPESLDFHDKTL